MLATGRMLTEVISFHSIPSRLSSSAHLNGPQRLAERPHSCARVEDDLRSVQCEAHPVERVVPPVAYVDADAPELGLKHGMPCVPFHVVRALVEVTHARNVVLVMGKAGGRRGGAEGGGRGRGVIGALRVL